MERIESEMIAKRIYVMKCAGSRPKGRKWKMWIDTLKECLKKSSLDFTQSKENGA